MSVHFYLNSKPVDAGHCDPNTTLLRFLRTETDALGTKEGCASGDCGACTLLVANADQTLSAINACICLLGSVANQQIYTVDGLAAFAQQDDTLHPVQRAMVEHHGSQCGFCTPGFVMSLTALYQRAKNAGQTPSREQVLEAISGNLCRCTGYRPIVDAGLDMLSGSASPIEFDPSLVPTEEVATGTPLLGNADRGFYRPQTEAELQQLLQRFPDAKLVAGGTDFALSITQLYQQHAQIIDLTQIPTLTTIETTDSAIEVGAAATYQQIEPILARHSQAAIGILHRLGSTQIRNRGTMGGNIANASPIADTPPMLLSWDADIELVNSRGERRWIKLNHFYLDYKKTQMERGEYLARIRIPTQELAKTHRFYKLSKRYEDDISAVMAAFMIERDAQQQITDVRIAFGGMAAIPKRAAEAEAVLLGATLDDTTLDAACDAIAREFSPLSDVRASAEYRLTMAQNLLRRCAIELSADYPHSTGVFQHA